MTFELMDKITTGQITTEELTEEIIRGQVPMIMKVVHEEPYTYQDGCMGMVIFMKEEMLTL